MQSVDKEVIQSIVDWLNSGKQCWLATVIETWGSSPRPKGSLLACNSESKLVGSLSGGCVEEDLLDKLIKGQLATNEAQFFQYGVTNEEAEKFGLPCGGNLDIVVEPHKPSKKTIQHLSR
jgi:Xanthine and CO dehydrogenases maturation factor, XdhC/CoxF family